MELGLRIDVDTFRGTKCGVPTLCAILASHSIKSTFFFSVGPDNMGRHIFRLIRPAFFLKMIRSSAPSLYGWDILFKGTLWPGPLIGEKLGGILRAVSDAGHEVGLHAWDHYSWQTHIEKMDRNDLHLSLKKGVDTLATLIGHPPACSAVPAWKCTNTALLEKEKFNFKYNSDCRGRNIFYPVVDGRVMRQPQIPVTLPTYDEVIGQKGITHSNYNEYILSLLLPEKPNVFTIHAEVEGIGLAGMFRTFIEEALSRNIAILPLGHLLEHTPEIPSAPLVQKRIKGREGWVSWSSGSSGDGS